MRIYPWILSAMLYSSTVAAFPSVVPDRVPCVSILETHFFVEPIVNQALSLYNIRQELWLPINEILQAKSAQVPERMKRKTAHMVPNPIEYPMQRAMTAKILKDVLFEVFREALRVYHVDDKAEHAFNYIFREQLPQFVRCFGPEAKKLEPKFD